MDLASSSPLRDAVSNDENDWSPVEVKKTDHVSYQTPETASSTTHDTPSTAATSTSSRLFTFEQRARSLSPRFQLSRYGSESREKRRTQFHERIRDKRDSARDERLGDQVLRMDFIQARKFWEEEMARRALHEAGTSGDIEMDEEQAEMSPTEEHEIQELVSYLDDKPPEADNDEDDEYDDAFRTIIINEQHDTTMDMS